VLRGRPVKLVRGEALTGSADAAPGTVLGLREGRLAVACGGGTIFGVELLQRPDKPARSAADFVNGERLMPDERLGGDRVSS
jgi:methionyl-tRNA formyltransferase